MNVIMERYPYRYVECGTLDNGFLIIVFKKKIITLRDTGICICVIIVCNTTAIEDFERPMVRS